MFSLFGKSLSLEKNNIGGYIAYYNLENWWLNSFTPEERKHIVDVFKSISSENDSLVKGEIEKLEDESPLSFLSTLASWFDNPRDRSIAYKIISKAEEYVNSEKNILTLHFFYSSKMKLFYKDRDKTPIALNESINSCLKQIEIADKAAVGFKKEYSDTQLPSHEGYSQLCIILEKQGKYEAAIKYAKQAKEQGWNGDWDKRIIRCQKKIKETN